MRGNAHVRFGGRAGETHITRVAQGAPVRPYYFNVRLQKDRPCVLVVVGATEDGHKELLAIQDGERESHLSWLHLLQDLKARGLKEHSFLAVGDGALGFRKALEEALPGARAQQCWVHKTANVLDQRSQRVRPDAWNEAAALDTPRTRFMRSYTGRESAGSGLSTTSSIATRSLPAALRCVFRLQCLRITVPADPPGRI